jgi:3-keto-disaccharide hydrolase
MHLEFYGESTPQGTGQVAVRRLSRSVFFAALAAIAVFVAGCAGTVESEAPFAAKTLTFSSSDVGKSPTDFTTALTGGGGPISWMVQENSHAPDGRFVLVQESADDTSYRFPLCVYDKFMARDVAVETKFKAISGKVDQAAGVVLRYNPENYYIARANALEDNIDLFKTVKGKRSKIAEVPVKVSAGEWHTLRFEALGPRLRVMFDGKLVIEKNDRTFTGPGKVGFWTKADSVSAFSDLKIEPVRR